MNTNYQISISKQQLAELPVAHFEGRISVVDHLEQVADAIADLRTSSIIGFDTETRPSFTKGQLNNVSLIQLSAEKVCYLFRLNKVGMPDELKALLEDPDIQKIGLSLHDDFLNLGRICTLSPSGFIDLQNYVKDFHIADNSLSKIYGIVFGKRITKGQRLTNWEATELTPSQQAYAALDAQACLQIYFNLRSGKFNPETSPLKIEL